MSLIIIELLEQIDIAPVQNQIRRKSHWRRNQSLFLSCFDVCVFLSPHLRWGVRRYPCLCEVGVLLLRFLLCRNLRWRGLSLWRTRLSLFWRTLEQQGTKISWCAIVRSLVQSSESLHIKHWINSRTGPCKNECKTSLRRRSRVEK